MKDLLDYFTTYKNADLETLAEAGAIFGTNMISGMSYRTQLLQKNFPRTLAYLYNKIQEMQLDIINAPESMFRVKFSQDGGMLL